MTPDQVLVLYNEDWAEDLPGTQPGQDSEEVARYYVARHTDPKTGKKPYLLGLSCVHRKTTKGASHLNAEFIEEASNDNFLGVVYRGTGRPLLGDELKKQKDYLLSTSIEVPIDTDRYAWDSVRMTIGGTGQESEATVVYTGGKSVPCPVVLLQDLGDGKGKRFLADGRRLGAAGEVYLWVAVNDKEGKRLIEGKVRYHDYGRITIPVAAEALDWDTFEAVAGDPTAAARRLCIWREGRSRIGEHLALHRDGSGRPSRLELNAEAAGFLGDFLVKWTGRNTDGEPLEGTTPVFRDRRLMRVEVPDPDGRVDWNSVTLRHAHRDDPAAARTLWEKGRCLAGQDLVGVREAETTKGGKSVQSKVLLANAKRGGFDGDVTVWVSAKGRHGGDDLAARARFFDPADLEVSRTGPDGVRDDLHYLADVEQPVKAFLEDPANLVDGKPLKDQILCVVVCYGLPRTVSRLYGIAQTAVPASRRDAGDLVSLCQRLESAYYEFEGVRPLRLAPARLKEQVGAFQAHVPVTTFWMPFVGRGAQPYLHPAAYQDFQKQPDLKPPWPYRPHVTPEHRRGFPKRFLFVCSRIDADDPRTAMYQVDAAEYATRYLTPRIGGPTEGAWDAAKAFAEASSLAGADELKKLGFPGADKSINHSAFFGRREQGGYFPGAVDWYVISGNGCNNPNSQVRRMLRDGVTVTGGAARAYRGCPHTTTHGWWDAKVFYHYLFRGYTLGEAWLFSKYKVQWCTSFFGDPLYCPDLQRTRFDRTAPEILKPDDVAIELFPAADRYAGILRADLATSPENPELVTSKVEYWRVEPGEDVAAAADPSFGRRPLLVLRDLEPRMTYGWRLVLTDPYGNVFDSRARWGKQTFRTGEPLPPFEPVLSRKDPTKLWIGGPGRKNMIGPDSGEVEVVFEARAGGGDIFRCGDLGLRISGDVVTFNPGGGVTGTARYAFDPKRVYRLRARYRHWPVTREVWLIAKDGSEFLLCADNRSPWRRMTLATEMTCSRSVTTGIVQSIGIYADSRVGSEEGRGSRVAFDADAFNRADGWKPETD